MFDRDQLETFATVAEEQSFERAASLLNITRGAVSQRIRGLEESFATVLLVREKPVARKRSANPPSAPLARRREIGYAATASSISRSMAAAAAVSALAAPPGRQMCGSSVCRSRCLSVGRRSSTSVR